MKASCQHNEAKSETTPYLTVLVQIGFAASGYNRVLRLPALVLTIFVLAACSKGPNADAARQAVLDRLTQMGMPAERMEVAVTNFEVNGKEADATVSLTLKEAKGAPPMVMKYRMEQQAGKWVVVRRLDEAGSPHGGGALPDAANPHGGAAMPSPEDLPPA